MELRGVFGNGVRREQLLEGLDRCFRLMHDEQLRGIVVIDGSFVTDKERPDDLELTLDVRAEGRVAQDRAIIFFNKHFHEVRGMGVDWYPTLPAKKDFTVFFQQVGEKLAAAKRIAASEKKGILRLDRW